MKKKHLTYGKKALSVFLAVLMLMTCWVFFPGEHNHASAVEQTNVAAYNASLVSGLSAIDTNVTTIYGKFPYDDSYLENSHYSQIYKNVLYYGAVTDGSDGADAYRWSVSLAESDAGGIAYYYPDTTFLYDGVTTPTTGIMLNVDAYGSRKIRSYSGYLTDTSNLKLMNSYWYGKDGRLNYQWCYFANSSTYCSTSNGTVNGSYAYTHSSGGDSYFYANILGFGGSMSDSEFYKEIYPSFGWKGNQASQGTGNVYTYTDFTVVTPIRVINYKPVKAAMTQANAWLAEIKANPAKYSTKSVVNFVNMFNKLAAAHPNKFVNSGLNNPSGYNTAASAAMSAYNSFSLEERKYDIQAENLFSFADWAYSSSSASNSAYSLSYDVNAGSVTITTGSNTSEATTVHSGTGTRNQNYYAVVVDSNTEYTLEWTSSSTQNAGNISAQMYCFFYDVNNQSFSNWSYFHKTGSANGTTSYTFTTPENAKYMEIRFDNNNSYYASNLTFKDIKVYKTSRANEISRDEWLSGLDYRAVYSYNGTVGTLETPTRKGYLFDGWQVDTDLDGVGDYDVTSTDKVTMTYPLYSKWTLRDLDVGYDNLFSLSDWAITTSVNPSNASQGTITYDMQAGTITAAHTSGTEVYTTYGSDGYTMDVEPNTEYVFEADLALSGDVKKGQMFVFFYDDTGAGATGAIYNGSTQTNSHIGTYPTTEGTQSMVFTTPATCTKIRIRVGATAVDSVAGTTATYSNIGIYEKADYDAYAKDYAKVREPFKYGDTTKLAVPTRDGYAFDGWYTADGTKLETVTGLYESETVFAQWAKEWTVTFLNGDGSVLETKVVVNGNDATAPVATPTKAPDADYEYEFSSWDKAFTAVTSDITVTPVFNEIEHTGIHVTLSSAPTCEAPGMVFKNCDCGYDWGEVLDDTGTYPALGHNYADVVKGSSTGVDGVHTLGCTRCDAETTAAHSYGQSTGQSTATCVTAGETYYLCACNQEKTVVGTIDANNHVNTELRDVVTAKCGVAGYSGDTWCKDCGVQTATGSETAALTHTYITYAYNNDAECEKDGTETASCDHGCGTTDTRTAADTALKHVYTNYTYNNDATCLANGTKTAACDHGCGAEDTIVAENTQRSHIFEGTIKNNGDGTHSYDCTYDDCDVYGGTVSCSSWTENAAEGKCGCKDCGYTKDHTWGAWTTTDKDATAAGKQTRTCTVCGAVEEEACVYTSVKTEATCTTDAYTTYTCEDNCGHGYTVWEQGSATGHDFTGDYYYDADTDKHQQLCKNGCGAYGVGTTADEWTDCVWSYENKETGKHTATCVCGNSEVQDCTGGTATCTAKAVCENCGAEYGETADHSYTGTEKYLYKAADATCIANETYYFYCIGCDQTIDGVGTYEKPDSMTAHDYTSKDEYLYIATQAKCGVNETYYAYCSNPDCKKSSEDANNTFEKADTALTHSWANPVTNNDGTHTVSCQNTNTDGWACTETLTLNCADSAISYGYEAPTCTSQGYTTYQCGACNYTWNADYEDALGHDYSEKIYNAAHIKSEANCTTPIVYWYDCSRCDKNAKDETDTDKYTTLYFVSTGKVRDHKWIDEVADEYLASPATCFAAAKYYKSCEYEDCGAVHTDNETFSYGAALAHDWKEVKDEKYLATAADCVTDATYYYECSACKNSSKDYNNGATWTDAGSKSGHALTHYEAVEVKCETDGNVEYWACSRCSKNFSDAEGETEITGSVVISAPGHDWVKYSFKAATCEENGHNAYEECSRCQTKKAGYEVYSATGHDFTGLWTYDTVYNYHSKLCLNECGVSGLVIDGNQVKYTVEYDLDEAVITGGEKCTFDSYTAETVDGVHSHKLSCKCGNTTSKTYADEDTFAETVAPECTANGYDLHKCPDCGETWQKNIVETEGHKYADGAVSNGDGTHSVVCSVCGDKKDTVKCSGGTATCAAKAECDICGGEYGEKGDHTLADDAWTSNNDAKCGKDGTKSQNCSVCQEKVTVTDEGSALTHVIKDYCYDLSDWKGMPEDFDKTSVYAPTCGSEGKSITYCTREGCGYYKLKTEKANKDAHVWEADANGELVWTVVGGNCATGITYKNECTVCGKTQTKTEATEHTWKTQLYIPATCVKNGCAEYVCTVCGYERDVYYDPADETTAEFKATGIHTWGEDITVEPTCAKVGYTYHVCQECELEEKTGDIAKLPHAEESLKDKKAVAPSCEEAGYSAYQYCMDCGEEIGKTVIAATGHNDNGKGKCTECNRVLYETDDKEGSCGCICHKTNWLMRLIYRILNFFWKLFRISKSCDCGNIHW